MRSDSRIRNYLLYAIGEIMLVVVGILIALQVNNWNEAQKDKASEIAILQEIRSNLTFDLTDFESNIAHLQNKAESSRSLLQAFEAGSPYDDSLGFYFYYLKTFPHFSYKSSGYKLLHSKGLGIIRNPALREQITNLYEDRYEYLSTYERERIDYNTTLEEKVSPYYGRRSLSESQMPANLVVRGSVQTLLAFDFFRNIRGYDALRNDAQLHGIIKDIETWSTILQAIHEQVRLDVGQLIQAIDEELALIN